MTSRVRLAAVFLTVALGCGGGGGGSSDPDAGAGSPDAGAVTCQAAAPFEWPVSTGPIAITPSPAWKNRIAARDDAFLSPWSPDPNAIRWIKFAVLLENPSKVYYQDSQAFEFHYDFVTQHLDPFVGMSRTEIDQISLYEQGQRLVLGAVLFPPRAERNEVAVQLVRADPYHPQMAKTIIDLIAASIDGGSGIEVRYFPTFEQAESAQACAGWYTDNGIGLGSIDEWLTTDSCYANGWGLGRLVYVPGSDIASAYTAGTLAPTDVLLTDAVPAEIPFVAGILTESAATPSSHVAILARSYGVPFAHLASDADVQAARALVGKQVVLRAYAGFEACAVDLFDASQIPAGDRAQILALKSPPTLSLQAMQPYGSYTASTTGLTAADVRYFGGKAANFGLLRAAIPANSPDAIAISFDLWNDFLDQQLGTGKTLRAEIGDRLSGFSYPPNMASVEQALTEIRTLILTQAVFTATQKQALLPALERFDPLRKVRFRSSTNVEDTDHFVGAGLYSSYSGCIADDTDGDAAGPSLCNASEPEERGAFRAIRKVYAGFYNTNAYLERLRYGVDENKVGMAVLVHHSFPDATELANGVAVGSRGQFSLDLELVTQQGAVSVANPSGQATPEVVSVYASGSNIYPTHEQQSSLVPLGATVMAWPDDYERLSQLLVDVTDLYAARNPTLDLFTLDFEYKKIEPGSLVVKQVRRLPAPDTSATWPVYLLNHPRRACLFQGEYGDALANHRLKSIWNIETHNRWLDATTLQSSAYSAIDFQYLDGTAQSTLAGDPTSWANATHSYDGTRMLDSWSAGSGPERRDWTLEVNVATQVSKLQSPIRVLDDHGIYVRVEYATPVPTIDWTGVTTTSSEYAILGTCPDDNVVTSINQRVQETVSAGGVSVTTAYYWPEQPRGIVAGYTAPLYKWDKTTITGLTSQPIELTGYWSQTYRPGHHNFSSDYVFDPWLEPGLPSSISTELQAANVRLLYIRNSSEIWILGLDDVLRQL